MEYCWAQERKKESVTRLALLLDPLPALVGSLLLLQSVHAGRGLLIQQALVALLASGACALALRRVRESESRSWPIAVSLVLLLLPLLLSHADGPRRWISLGGFRFYLASALLPATILILQRSLCVANAKTVWLLAGAVGIAAVLAAHPDASQATAFALSCTLPILSAKAKPLAKALTLLALVFCAAFAWRQPDPLQPIPYVEGVLGLAQNLGLLALISALLAVALPPGVLLWQARLTKNHGLIGVAVYYVAIAGFVAVQLTPMPLLGFGAGPILGYFAMAFLAAQVAEWWRTT